MYIPMRGFVQNMSMYRGLWKMLEECGAGQLCLCAEGFKILQRNLSKTQFIRNSSAEVHMKAQPFCS